MMRRRIKEVGRGFLKVLPSLGLTFLTSCAEPIETEVKRLNDIRINGKHKHDVSYRANDLGEDNNGIPYSYTIGIYDGKRLVSSLSVTNGNYYMRNVDFRDINPGQKGAGNLDAVWDWVEVRGDEERTVARGYAVVDADLSFQKPVLINMPG